MRPPAHRGLRLGGEINHQGALNYYHIFIPRFESQVSGVSVQGMLLRQSFLTPET